MYIAEHSFWINIQMLIKVNNSCNKAKKILLNKIS